MRTKLVQLLSIGLILVGVVGCESIQSAMRPTSTERVEDTTYLCAIARQLGLETPPRRSATDLASDIRLFLDDASLRVPEPVSEEFLNELRDVVRPDEWKRLSENRKFLLELKGRRVLVLPKQ